MDKSTVKRKIIETGVIPVIRASSRDEAMRAVEAIRNGGIEIFEITMTVPGAVKLIETLAARFQNEALIGAGTVLNVTTARDCINAGAQFVISPALDTKTIAFCKEKEILVMPGALTPTEIVTADAAGADFVKIFPAGAMGGASYIKSLKAPLPHIEMIPTGGVSLANAADFIKAGASAVGVGAELVDLKSLREGNEKLLTEKARQYLETVAQAREI
jgi:Entner-Doudoroff aldolase